MSMLKQLNQQVQELKTRKNEGDLGIYDLMATLQNNEAWKTAAFYKGCESQDKTWRTASFPFILKQITGWNMARFSSLVAIVQMPEGRALFLKYGHENCVALKNLNADERPKLLAAVEKHVANTGTTPRFHYMIHKVFPGKRIPTPIADGEKAQVAQLKRQIELLKALIAKLQKENAILRDQVIAKLVAQG